MNASWTIRLVLGAAGMAFASFAVAQPAATSPDPAARPECKVAAVDPDHAFIAASVYQGETLTNLQLNTPDHATTAIRVMVAPGDKPITVLLQAEEAVIWDFEGAVERVARAIVLTNSERQAAIHGLSAQQGDFLQITGCPQPSIPLQRIAGDGWGGIIRQTFGRAPDRVVAKYAATSLELPDGSFQSPAARARTAATPAEQDLLHFFPGGFRVIEPASVLSAGAVLAPETWPAQAGLMQLERAGAIRPPGRAETEAFVEGISRRFRSRLSPDYRMRLGFDYVVTREITMPAGLYGAHSKNFLVLPGVPEPRGKTGHGCLAFMDGFRIKDDPGNRMVCYGDNRQAIEQLQNMPGPEATKSCRLLEPPRATTIEAVSIYQPAMAPHSRERIPAPVDVTVSKAGAVLLVLESYEPAIWRVAPGVNTRIAAVILKGYYSSKVEGVDPDTPVFALNPGARQTWTSPGSPCAPLYQFTGTGFRGGPAALVLNRHVNALTGRDVDAMRGGYSLGEVEIR